MKVKSFVFDTNALISAFLSPNSTNATALKLAENIGDILFSPETFKEFCNVLLREKFDKYFSREFRLKIIETVALRYAQKEPSILITECRDPKDNMFLSLAVSESVDAIITGDSDLLILNPFREISIINAKYFLELYQNL